MLQFKTVSLSIAVTGLQNILRIFNNWFILQQGKQDIWKTGKNRIEQVPQVNRRKSQRKVGDQSKVRLIPKSRVKQVPGLQSEAEVRCIRTGEAQNVQQLKMK